MRVMVALRTGVPPRVVVADAGGTERSTRLTWHPDERRFVLSHWDGRVCIASVQISPEDAAELLVVLAEGVSDAMPGWALADDR